MSANKKETHLITKVAHVYIIALYLYIKETKSRWQLGCQDMVHHQSHKSSHTSKKE